MINLEEKYKNYLQLVELKEKEMSEIQKVETKRAFFGGCTEMIKVFKRELDNMSAKDFINMENQIIGFWGKELENDKLKKLKNNKL